MKLSLISATDRGVAGKERLALRATQDTVLSFYLVLVTKYLTPTTVSNVPQNVLWFPAKPVKAGDWVVVMTGKGTQSEKKNTDGTTTHYFFLGSDKTVWNRPEDCAILVEATTWQTTPFAGSTGA